MNIHDFQPLVFVQNYKKKHRKEDTAFRNN